MKNVLRLLRAGSGKKKLYIGVFLQLLSSVFTLLTIPLVIPFFQILFGISPGDYQAPSEATGLQGYLNYGFTRLIAMTDRHIALMIVCIGVVVIFFLKNFFRYSSDFILAVYRHNIIASLRQLIWSKTRRISYLENTTLNGAEMQTLMSNDVEHVDHGVMKAVEICVKSPIIMVGSLLFMCFLSMRLTGIAIVLLLFVAVIIGALSNKLKSISQQMQVLMTRLLQYLNESLINMRVERAHGWIKYNDKRFDKVNSQLTIESISFIRRRDLASPVSEFLGIVVIVVLLYFGTKEVLNGALSAESFFAFILAFYYIIAPAKNFSREYANIQRGVVSLERILLNTSSTQFDKEDNSPSPIDFVRLELIDASFSYSQAQKVLDSAKLMVKKGEKIAIIGESGEGKSTLVNIMLGLILLDRGTIHWTDQTGNNFAPRQVSNQLISLVTQESLLYDDTVHQNIIWGDDNQDDALFESAIHISGIGQMSDRKDFLVRRVGPMGSMLSGGERQRVCLARAIYRGTPVLIFDEPTSQLDQDTKSTLYPSFLQALKDQTLILITHDMDLLQYVDRIMVLRDGKLIERKKH